MIKNSIKTIAVISIFWLASCATPPDFPIEPELEFLSIFPDTMLNGVAQEDQVEIVVGFTDGDGDIGFPQGAGAPKNLFLINRETGDTLVDQFTIPDIPEQGSSNGIRGEIKIVLYQQCCDFPPNSGYGCGTPGSVAPEPFDDLLIDVVLMDAAGNYSNRVQATPLTLICD